VTFTAPFAVIAVAAVNALAAFDDSGGVNAVTFQIAMEDQVPTSMAVGAWRVF
jgi:hypothetical protein